MAHTITFVANTSTDVLEKTQDNEREYLHNDGKYYTPNNLIIEVYGYNHKAEAEKIYNTLKAAGLIDKYHSISISPK